MRYDSSTVPRAGVESYAHCSVERVVQAVHDPEMGRHTLDQSGFRMQLMVDQPVVAFPDGDLVGSAIDGTFDSRVYVPCGLQSRIFRIVSFSGYIV